MSREAPAVDAVILDLGNVLVFHDNDYLFRRFADVAGVSPAEVRRRVDPRLWERVNRGELVGDGVRAELNRALGIALDDRMFFAIWNSHFRVREDVLPIVETLFGRVKVALLSNTHGLHFDFLRPQMPILGRFDALFLSHEVRLAKPDAAIFEHAVKTLRIEPARAIFFDDLPEYVEAAKSVGLVARVFTTAAQFRSDLASVGL